MTDPLSRQKSGYIPTLDGWRAVAILSVMVFHAGPFVVGGVNLFPLQSLGIFGVQLFFAISGILICTRLLDEEERLGRISLRAFYIRRLFRIQPAAFVFLGSVVLLSLLGAIPLDKTGLWTALLSVRNFYSPGNTPGHVYIGHFWSLGVEEHFYLVMPFLLIFLKGRGRILWFGLMTAVSILLIFHATHQAVPPKNLGFTQYQLGWLFLPAWLSLLIRASSIRAVFVKYLPAGPIVLLGVGGTMVIGVLFHKHFLVTFLMAALSLMVFSTIFHPESWCSRFLECYPLRAIGRISFSLYLWQQLFCLNPEDFVPESSWFGFLQHRPQNFLFPFILATASYFLVEKPMIRLGHRMFPPATPGHRDLAETEADRGLAKETA